eukprot:g5064.t1
MTGYPMTAYGELVKMHCDVTLPKGATMSDWLQRPLSDVQLKYAEDDVLYLESVVDSLELDLSSKGRLEWAKEECAKFDDIKYYKENIERDMSQIFPRLKKVKSLTPEESVKAFRLAQWRENTAREQNVPIYFIARDDSLIEMAKIKFSDEAMGNVIKRIDPSDNKPYSKDEFSSFYGNDDFHEIWENAKECKETNPDLRIAMAEVAKQSTRFLKPNFLRRHGMRMALLLTKKVTEEEISFCETLLSSNASQNVFDGLSKKERARTNAITMLAQAYLQNVCAAVDIDNNMVMKPNELKEIVAKIVSGALCPQTILNDIEGGKEIENLEVMNGWRGELVGKNMMKFFVGDLSVGFDPVKGKPVFHTIEKKESK